MLPEREDGQHLAISISRMTDTDLEIDTIFLLCVKLATVQI